MTKKEAAVSAADKFLDAYFSRGAYLREAVDLLCMIATKKDARSQTAGAKALFTTITERLCDSFNKEGVLLCDRLLAQIIGFCRRLPESKRLDSALAAFGIRDERDMLERRQRLGFPRRFPVSGRKGVKKIFILSRVTIGSDVAVTGVVIQKLKHIFKQAQIIFLASPKLEELFGADKRVKILPVGYARRGGVTERLSAWVDLADLIEKETKGFKSCEYLIVDPDSRLTQLGLLPLGIEDSYYFFESRSYNKKGIGSLGALTAEWAGDVFGATKERPYPYLALNEGHKVLGARIRRLLRAGGARHLVSVNFGIGGNPQKRISGPFEEELINGLIRQGSTVILDKGSSDEIGETDRLISRLRRKNKKVIEINAAVLKRIIKSKKINCDVLVWEGGVGVFSALIASSDRYVGYDSAFQHIAAAQEVPVVIIFAGAPSDIFFRRWKVYGRGPARIIRALEADKKNYRRIIKKVLLENRQRQG